MGQQMSRLATDVLYSYAPLASRPDDGVYSVRLLHLLPASDTAAPLQCRLVEAEIPDYLPDPNAPGLQQAPQCTHEPYHALSYTWGNPVFPDTLEVLPLTDTPDQGCPPDSVAIINITRNLHSALQNLRRSHETLVLWVDAVCINQADVPERNEQVRNIPKTYTEASSVIVWLGTDSPAHDGNLSLGFFHRLTELIAPDEADSQTAESSWRRRFETNRMVSTFLDDTKAVPIISFLERPWFRRRWIIQEVVLAKEVILHCGASSIPWSTFETAMIELYENDKGVFSPEHRLTLRTMTRMRHENAGAKRQLPLDTLAEFSCFVCANPRDRLYALYGVIQHWFPGTETRKHNQTGDIDYALSTEEVFTNFAILMMRLDKTDIKTAYKPTTHVLQLAAAFQHPRSQPAQSGQLCGKVPSWVVDWTGTLSFEPLNHSPESRNASEGIPVHPVEILPAKDDTHLLVAVGRPFDVVTASISLDILPLLLTGAVHEAKKTLNQFLCHVAQKMSEVAFKSGEHGNTYEPTTQHIVAAIATALVANWEHTPANSYFAQHPRFPNDFLEQLASVRHHLPEILHKWPAYVELVTITMRGRSLILTAKGYLGIAATDVEAGDVVCLLSDNKIPFILRPRNGPAMGTGGVDKLESECFDFDGSEKGNDSYTAALSQLRDNPSAHKTFRLMGDAYIHGLMQGTASSKSAQLKLLPIA
ncbi:heterokaryon incompatibility protein-domain-containing protein [Podospora conica]|nr:heterokaryon incompatibility protein-domain-containing protein [Schizothecium conicum]